MRTKLILDETMQALDLRPDTADGSRATADQFPDAFRLGSLAKTVWNGLRVGWLRGSPAAIEALASTPASYLPRYRRGA
jgi:DNA-binding transcriptional MocR family regulator